MYWFNIYIYSLHFFINMSSESTGLIDVNANYVNSDIIDVNQKLTVNHIDIVDWINNFFNDLSWNIKNLSINVMKKIMIYH